MSTKKREAIEWLQLSDLHVFSEGDTEAMLMDFEQLASVIHPQFIVVTGDYRHLKYKTEYSKTCEHLSEIVKKFHLEKKDVFLVPGNHDVDAGENLERDGAIGNILEKMKGSSYKGYVDYLDSLKAAFKEYKEFVALFYSDAELDEEDKRITDAESVFCSVWNNCINLLHVNTALISDRKRDDAGNRVHPEILDYRAVVNSLRNIDKHRPTLVLAHHGIDSLHNNLSGRLVHTLDICNVSAYLHGDIHVLREIAIRKENPRERLPQIACGKSTPQDEDTSSDLGVVFYSWRVDDEVEVKVYKWTPTNGFSRYCHEPFAYGINNDPYTFPMLYEHGSSPAVAPVAAGDTVETENKLTECLNMIVRENITLKRRDIIDYDAGDWVKLYSLPIFFRTRRVNTPIPNKRPIRTIVVSPSGYGKSVLLQGLALLYAQKCLSSSLQRDYQEFDDAFRLGKKLFPISVRAKDFNTVQEKDILAYAMCSVLDEAEKVCIDHKTMENLCQRGEALLLIDSLDEVHEDKIRDFIDLIRAHATTFPNTSIIITSRNIPGLRELSSFEAYKLSKFSEEQIYSQIEKRSSEYAEQIKQRIKNDENLKKMASSPIMLATMLSKMSSTPNAGDVVDFLKEITDNIIKLRWKDFDLLVDRGKAIKALLSGLAWKLLFKNEDGIPKDNLRKIVEDVFHELEETGYAFEWKPDSEALPFEERINQLTTDLGRRSGILNLEDTNTQYVFQEDLVKCYLGAAYVQQLLFESQEYRSMPPSEIIVPIDKQISISPLNENLVHALIMSISLLKPHQQQALLKYILLRGTCSMNDDEIHVINDGLLDLLKNTYGTNGILNPRLHSSSWELSSVIRWLYHHGDSKTILFLKRKYPEYFNRGY